MKCRAASALALVAVATVAAAAAGAGDAPAPPAGLYDNPICGTAASPCKPCNRTFRIGAPRLAAPAALGIMGKSLDFLDACFAFYDQPSGVVALDWVEAGFLDMAVVCSTSFVAAAARGAKVTVVAVPFTDIESNALVAREGLNLLSDLRHKTLWTVEGSNAHLMLLGTLQSASVVVVALFGFAAGAATATAAPHVAAKMNLASGTAWAPGIAARTGGENDSGIDIDGPPPADAAAQGEPYVDCTTLPDGCAPGKQSVDGTGAEDPTVVQNDLTGGGRDAGETVIVDGRK